MLATQQVKHDQRKSNVAAQITATLTFLQLCQMSHTQDTEDNNNYNFLKYTTNSIRCNVMHIDTF